MAQDRDPDTIDRERLATLAADLELLGILGDPQRGPLAHLYSPPHLLVETGDQAAGPSRWRCALRAALASMRRGWTIVAARARWPARRRAALPTR